MRQPPAFNHPLFGSGFRPLFILAGFAGVFLLTVGQLFGDGRWSYHAYYPSLDDWRAHELLLGYATAAIAGLLLVAVKRWTGQDAVRGDALAGLCLLWVYGRIAPFYAGLLADGLIALIDFAFLPLVAFRVGAALVKANLRRQLVFVAFLLVLAAGNALVHGQVLAVCGQTAQTGITVALAAQIVLVVAIAGPVMAGFAERGLSAALILDNPLANALALATTCAFFISQAAAAPANLTTALAIAAALSNGQRWLAWHTSRLWYLPLSWVLYLGYGWIIAGFLLSAAASQQLLPQELALHAYGTGGISVLGLGAMARLALTHTGRAPKANPIITASFVLINLAAVSKVALPALLPAWQQALAYLSVLCGLAAFALFVFVVAPLLTAPAADHPHQ